MVLSIKEVTLNTFTLRISSYAVLTLFFLYIADAAEIRVSSLDQLSLIVEGITPSKYGPKYAVKEKHSDDENDDDDPDIHDRSSGPEESP